MRQVLKILLVLLVTYSCKPQSEKILAGKQDQTYTRINDESSWGFVNQNKKTIIPLGKYKFLNPIDEEGMIFAQLVSGKYGYINIHQDTLIPFKYEDLGVFAKGLAPAKFNGKIGYINRKGQVVIPFEYETETYFYDSGLAIAKRDGRFGFIDTTGREIIPIEFEQVDQSMTDTVVLVSKGGKWAFYSKNGERKTDFQYDEVIETYIKVGDRTKSSFFGNGLALVEKADQKAYLNFSLEEIVPFGTYEVAEPFQNNLAIVARNGKYGIIDTLGKIVLPLTHDFIEHPKEYSNSSDFFVIKKDQSIQLLDKKANPITDFNIKEYEWDSYKSLETFYRYFILTNKAGMVGTVSENGTNEIPFIYEKIQPFDGRAVTYARKDGKYGLIDYKGDVLLPFSYQDITPVYYDDNRFIVQENGLFGLIDIDENVIIPIEYEKISNWVEYGPEEHFITKGGKEGLISREGQIVIPPQYDRIWVNNSKLIKVKNNGSYGTIDWKNNIVHPIKYEMILWEWPYLAHDPLDTIYLKKNGAYFSTDASGRLLERKVDKGLIEEKFGNLLDYE